MLKLEPVEIARKIMTEGQEWSVMHWLFEKRRVRQAADKATAALAEAREAATASWSDDLWKAYAEAAAAEAIAESPRARHAYEKAREDAAGVAPAVRQTAQKIREADRLAFNATMDAEEMFAEAERKMSAGMARDAARKALESYDLREKAIRKAESAGRGRSRAGSA